MSHHDTNPSGPQDAVLLSDGPQDAVLPSDGPQDAPVSSAEEHHRTGRPGLGPDHPSPRGTPVSRASDSILWAIIGTGSMIGAVVAITAWLPHLSQLIK